MCPSIAIGMVGLRETSLASSCLLKPFSFVSVCTCLKATSLCHEHTGQSILGGLCLHWPGFSNVWGGQSRPVKLRFPVTYSNQGNAKCTVRFLVAFGLPRRSYVVRIACVTCAQFFQLVLQSGFVLKQLHLPASPASPVHIAVLVAKQSSFGTQISSALALCKTRRCSRIGWRRA